ncbi:MAG: DUF1501 domain-containing protein [Gemmataceae bacterium]
MSAPSRTWIRADILDDTLLVVMGGGRTPRFSKDAGLITGGKRGLAAVRGCGRESDFVLGKTDKHGAFATQRPVSPADVAYTILDAMGIDPRKQLRTPDGRPISRFSTRRRNREGNVRVRTRNGAAPKGVRASQG